MDQDASCSPTTSEKEVCASRGMNGLDHATWKSRKSAGIRAGAVYRPTLAAGRDVVEEERDDVAIESLNVSKDEPIRGKSVTSSSFNDVGPGRFDTSYFVILLKNLFHMKHLAYHYFAT